MCQQKMYERIQITLETFSNILGLWFRAASKNDNQYIEPSQC